MRRAFEGGKPWQDTDPISVEFKRQVAQEFLAGKTLHGLAKRHDISRKLIRIWVEKYERGAFDEEAQASDLIQAHEARIAAPERLVGKQAFELEFLKGAQQLGPRPRSAPTSVIAGPRGLTVAEGCRLRGIARSTYYDAPKRTADDTALVETMHAIKDDSRLTAGAGCRQLSASRAGL